MLAVLSILSKLALFEKIAGYGFVSGSSNHIHRMNTIRETEAKYGVVIDTHTADGLKVAIELRDLNTPMLVLETALPAKFEDAIVEALGHAPDRPATLEGIENLPQRFEVMNADVDAVKSYIVANT